ncbi:MAG: heavy-metal-associated domain-containing protein [Thermoprotei archaeon]
MQKKVLLRVFGMNCDDCVVKVTKGLRERTGVIDAKVSLREGKAEVLIDPDKVDPKELERLPVFSGRSPYRAQLRGEESE